MLTLLPTGLPVPPPTPPTPTSFTIFSEPQPDQVPAQRVQRQKVVALEPRQPRTLLVEAFGKHKQPKPVLKQTHNEFLTQTPLGRDFTLNTSQGVEFKIHVTMILGRSNMLQEYIYPGGVASPSPPSSVDLPPSFFPLLVDRLVNFLYVGDYNTSTGSHTRPQTRVLRHATRIPEGSSVDSYDLPEVDPATFHLHMLSAAEALDYPALYDFVYARLTTTLLKMGCVTASMSNVIKATFSPASSDMRIGKDEHGWVQNLVVAATIMQESRHWNAGQKDRLREMLPAEQYEAFWTKYDEAKAATMDIMPAPKEKPLQTKIGPKDKKVMKKSGPIGEGRVLKPREARKAFREDQKRTEALLKGLENLGLS